MGSRAPQGLHRPWVHPVSPVGLLEGADGAVLAAGWVQAMARLFCTLCDVALVTLASFPSHGFSLAAPPRASALAARPRPVRTRDVTPCSAVCFWGREASPWADGLAGVPEAPWPHVWAASCWCLTPRRRIRPLPLAWSGGTSSEVRLGWVVQ